MRNKEVLALFILGQKSLYVCVFGVAGSKKLDRKDFLFTFSIIIFFYKKSTWNNEARSSQIYIYSSY